MNSQHSKLDKPVLACRALSKSYRQGDETLHILKQLDIAVYAGERLAIVGASGSGKSTLLSLMGALDSADSGSVEVAGNPVNKLSDNKLSSLRNRYLGFVYQFHHLLPEFSALENVAMPLLIAGKGKREALKAAEQLLEKVGLCHRSSHKPGALSGGERQRVAIARALVNKPVCVLMDEPTGNLDSQASQAILQLIGELAEHSNTAFIVVTHDENVAAAMDKIYALDEGRLISRSTPR